MKRFIIIMLVLLAFSCFAKKIAQKQVKQDAPFQDEFVIVSVENGVGMKSDAKFVVRNSTKREILESEVLSKFLNGRTDSLRILKLTLSSMANVGVFAASYEVKNRNSFEFYGVGSIFVHKDCIAISIPFRAQNGWGNYVVSSMYYMSRWNDEKGDFDGFVE